MLPVLEDPDSADRRRWKDREAGPILVLGFIVERYVPAHDREIERLCSLGHALDAADELAHDLGPLRIAEVQAVRDGERRCTDSAKVPICLGDRLLPAL